MNIELYLVVSARKRYTYWEPGATRVTKKKPSLASNEVAIHVNLDIPTALFEKPVLTFTATLPNVSGSFDLTPKVQANIADYIRQQTGMTVEIKAPEPEAEQLP
jgi:hypothetical protein